MVEKFGGEDLFALGRWVDVVLHPGGTRLIHPGVLGPEAAGGEGARGSKGVEHLVRTRLQHAWGRVATEWLLAVHQQEARALLTGIAAVGEITEAEPGLVTMRVGRRVNEVDVQRAVTSVVREAGVGDRF